MPVNEGENCSQCHDTEDRRQGEHLFDRKSDKKSKLYLIVLKKKCISEEKRKKNFSQCHNTEDYRQGEDLLKRN